MLLSLYKGTFSIAVIFNHETLRHEVIGAAAAGVAMAAVPIPEDSAFTSYLYVHTAYRKLSNGIEAPLGSNPRQLNTLHSQYSSNEKSVPLFSFVRYMPASFHYITLSLLSLHLLTMQVKARIENEQYLRKHPEIAAMVSSFVR